MRHFSVAITSLTIFLSSLMFSLSAQSNQPVWCDDALSEDEKVEAILSQLTMEEKVKLCAAQGKFTTPGVPRLGIPELWYSDGPHGVRAEINWNDWGYAKWRND